MRDGKLGVEVRLVGIHGVETREMVLLPAQHLEMRGKTILALHLILRRLRVAIMVWIY